VNRHFTSVSVILYTVGLLGRESAQTFLTLVGFEVKIIVFEKDFRPRGDFDQP
jgi:hypothetical protein